MDRRTDGRTDGRTDRQNSYINTIRYDSVYLTCSKKLTGSQLSPPHGNRASVFKRQIWKTLHY